MVVSMDQSITMSLDDDHVALLNSQERMQNSIEDYKQGTANSVEFDRAGSQIKVTQTNDGIVNVSEAGDLHTKSQMRSQ